MSRLRARLRTLAARPVLLLGIVIAAAVLRLGTGVLTDAGADKDALNNLLLAHGLATTGTMVESDGDVSLYREPLPVALYALQMRLDPRLDGLTREGLAVDGPAMRALRQQHLLWAALLLAGVALQARRLAPAGWRTPAAVGAVVLVHAMLLETVVDTTLTELHAATLLVWAGLAAQRWVEGQRAHDAVALGVLLGLGALTKSSLLYIGATFLVVLAGMLLVRERPTARRTLVTVGVALAGLALVVLPWMARNAATFDTWSIADRGGLSLWYRAVYEDATPAELRGSWYAFTPGPLQPVVGAVVGVDDADLDGALRRAHRFHPDEKTELRSFYSLARADRLARTDAYLAAGVATRAQARVMADQDLLADGLEVLRADPWLFVSTTPMFLWRGTWVVRAAPLLPEVVLGLLNPLAMLAILAAATAALARVRPARFAVVGLPFGVVAFSALLTMYEPRFTEPALPTALVLLTVAVVRIVAARRRPARRHARRPARVRV